MKPLRWHDEKDKLHVEHKSWFIQQVGSVHTKNDHYNNTDGSVQESADV